MLFREHLHTNKEYALTAEVLDHLKEESQNELKLMELNLAATDTLGTEESGWMKFLSAWTKKSGCCKEVAEVRLYESLTLYALRMISVIFRLVISMLSKAERS